MEIMKISGESYTAFKIMRDIALDTAQDQVDYNITKITKEYH